MGRYNIRESLRETDKSIFRIEIEAKQVKK